MKYTDNLGLKKPDLTDYVNVEDFNENADTIDLEIDTAKKDLSSHKADKASLDNEGHIQLSNSTTSTSETLAATPKAVKSAYDRANEAFQSASDGKNLIATAITGKGIPTSSSDTFATMAGNIDDLEIKRKIEIGNEVAGFYGLVTGLITGNELISKTGVTAGTTQVTGDITWLEFSYKGKTLLFPNQRIKSVISWDQINSAGCVYGKNIVIKGKTYKVRLMLGGNADPASAGGREWNDLIVNLTPSLYEWKYVCTWCQEGYSNEISNRVFRGYNNVDDFSSYITTTKNGNMSWAPILELVS